MAKQRKPRTPPKLTQGYRDNFSQLQRAFDAGHVCLASSIDKRTGKPVALVCAISQRPGETELDLVPFAVMVDCNPYRRYVDPTTEAN